jgi:hypothetical protein
MDDGTSVNKTFTLPANCADGSYHKLRGVYDRSGNFEMFLDGVTAGTQSLAAASGDTITHAKTQICGVANINKLGEGTGVGIPLFLRVSIGSDVLSNNLGGPGNG